MLPLIVGSALVVAALGQERAGRDRRRGSAVLGMSDEGSSGGIEAMQLLGIPGPWKDGLPDLEVGDVDVDYVRVEYDPDNEDDDRRFHRVPIAGKRAPTSSVTFVWGGRMVLFLTWTREGRWEWIGGANPDPGWWQDTFGIETGPAEASLLTAAVTERGLAMAPIVSRPVCGFCERRITAVHDEGDADVWEPICRNCNM